MADHQLVYQVDLTTQPLQRLPLGNKPVPVPDWRRTPGQKPQIPDPKMEGLVNQMNAFLKDEK